MAPSQLLQRRSCSFLHRNAIQRPVTRFSSLSSDNDSQKPSQLKKTGMAKEQRAEAVESFVKKDMERNPGTCPKPTHIQNEVGGSWYTVKDTLHRIKEKLLGASQPGIDHGLIDSVPALASPAPNFNIIDQPDSGAQTQLAVFPQSMDENIGHAAVNAPVESSSDMVVDATFSDVTNKPDSSGSCELHAASLPLSAKSEREVSGGEKDASAIAIPPVSSCQTDGIMELNAISDNLGLELKNGHMLRNKVHSNTCRISGRDLALNSAKLSDLEHIKVNYTGYRDQQENKDLTCSLFLKLCCDTTDKSALNRSSEKVSSLADLFRDDMEDEKITELNSSDSFSSSESPSNMQAAGLNKSSFTKYENHPPEEEVAVSNERQSVISKEMEPLGTAKNTGSSTYNQASKVMSNTNSDMLMKKYMGYLEEHKEKDRSKTFEIRHLIDCIKKLPQPSTSRSHESTPTCKNDGSNKRSLSWGTESLASLQSLRENGRNVSEGTVVCGKLEDNRPITRLSANVNIDHDTASPPEFTVPDLKSLLTNKKESNEIRDRVFQSKESDRNKAVVKFLRTVKKSDIYNAFQDCGDILKVEISNVEGAFYQIAYVYFRTRVGLRKALEKTDLCIRNANLTVEAADLIEDISNEISIPTLIGDPNVPAAFVKSPTRTVMIRKLTHDISSRHIEAALTFCGSSITGFFLGSSNSVAYVEFETEDGKEAALAKRSIHVLGKQLLISRIDVPRTTVVRISHDQSIKIGDIVKECKSVGKVRAATPRCEGLLEVHYRIAEWPNMLNILNRLNEIEVDGRPLLAQPATVIPPDILHVLWRQPEERKHVKAMLQKVLQGVGENPIRADFLDLVERFCREKC